MHVEDYRMQFNNEIRQLFFNLSFDGDTKNGIDRDVKGKKKYIG